MMGEMAPTTHPMRRIWQISDSSDRFLAMFHLKVLETSGWLSKSVCSDGPKAWGGLAPVPVA